MERVFVLSGLGFNDLKDPQQPQIMETNNCKCHFVFCNNKGILIWTQVNLANRAVSFTSSLDVMWRLWHSLQSFITTLPFNIPQRERGSVWDVHYYSEGVCVTDCASLQPLWIDITQIILPFRNWISLLLQQRRTRLGLWRVWQKVAQNRKLCSHIEVLRFKFGLNGRSI